MIYSLSSVSDLWQSKSWYFTIKQDGEKHSWSFERIQNSIICKRRVNSIWQLWTPFQPKQCFHSWSLSAPKTQAWLFTGCAQFTAFSPSIIWCSAPSGKTAELISAISSSAHSPSLWPIRSTTRVTPLCCASTFSCWLWSVRINATTTTILSSTQPCSRCSSTEQLGGCSTAG